LLSFNNEFYVTYTLRVHLTRTLEAAHFNKLHFVTKQINSGCALLNPVSTHIYTYTLHAQTSSWHTCTPITVLHSPALLRSVPDTVNVQF